MIHRLLRRRSDDSRSESIWLTVYSDLMTNLVLVFLALYGLVTMGNQAMQHALESMRAQASIVNPEGKQVLALEDVAQLLRQEFKQNPEISISEEPGTVRILFGESILFPSGRAELKDGAAPTLERAANLLALLPYTIVVEGHTDDRPTRKGSAYRDNWELSLARSMAVVNLLIKESGIPAKQVAAAAYGPYHPRASNETVASRRFNRRVELALFRDFPYAL
jgi:chemotaxis protein MotB